MASSSFSVERSTRTVEVRRSEDWSEATSAAASPDCGKAVRSAFEVVSWQWPKSGMDGARH